MKLSRVFKYDCFWFVNSRMDLRLCYYSVSLLCPMITDENTADVRLTFSTNPIPGGVVCLFVMSGHVRLGDVWKGIWLSTTPKQKQYLIRLLGITDRDQRDYERGGPSSSWPFYLKAEPIKRKAKK